MKKISILLLIVILFNFIFGNCYNISYATDVIEGQEASYDKESFDKLTEEGIVNLNGSDEKLTITTSTTGSTSGITASIFSPLFMVISKLMSDVANAGGFWHTNSSYGAAQNYWFTISSLVFDEYLLFDAKIYQTAKSLNPDIQPTGVINLMDTIKSNALGWFELLRMFALGLFLVLLIYGGARLLAATLADDRAKWKKVIFTWLTALIFVFFIPYVIIFVDKICQIFMDILWTVRLSLEDNGYASFEVIILTTTIDNLTNVGGIKALAYAIEYSVFVIFQVIFFGKYFIRSLKIMILVVLSPVIAVLHTFNVMSGKDLNVLKEWFVDYSMNVAIQPIHAAVYLIFLFTASQIAINAPLLALVFLWVLIRAEKIIKLMFNINNKGKISSLFRKK